jgi:hypothetical protein
MSAKKAGKTRAASPPRKATRIPKTEAARRGTPPTAAADDERNAAEAAPAAAPAPAGAPAGPADALMAETQRPATVLATRARRLSWQRPPPG